MNKHENCGLCFRDEKYKRLDIKEFDNWGLTLFDNQYYLGRSILYLKRHAIDFFTDITKAEQEELFDIMPEIKKSINDAYNPDLFNYATLGNEVTHVHLHIIPRYINEREVGGIVFRDKNWGKNYVPYDKNFATSEPVLVQIRDAIKSNFSS